VTIDGIAVDGVSAYPFGASSVWCSSAGGNCSPLFHGNAAITLVVASDAVIRNCDIKNAYFGINVKDRNTGGVFGNPNPDDRDVIIPLAGFGKAGSHLIEYNRVRNNSVGFFFESAWDLGSTVRYNLIYNNFHTGATKTALSSLGSGSAQNAGGILFKDTYLTPVAIYNNTLYNNTANLLGDWQTGGQHLIFNNIFSKSNPSDNPSPSMTIDDMFPNRMHNSVFSATVLGSVRDDFICAANAEIAPGGYLVNAVIFQGFRIPASTAVSLANCKNGQTSTVSAVLPGALIAGSESSNSTLTIPASANIRWLQTEGYGTALRPLFKSVDPAHPDFLFPDWDNAQVQNYIKNKGWVEIGIRNTDGTIADLGAIPSSGALRQTTTARIKPSNVVRVNGTAATLDFSLNVQSGAFNNPKIKLLRWVSPIPVNTGTFANDLTVIPASSIRAISPLPSAVLASGGNKLTVILPAALPTTNKYGFFEMVVEGTDANGNTVTSDIGFLPYRQHDDYSLNIEFFPPAGAMTAATRLTEVNAGDPVRMRVTALKGDAEFTAGPLSDVNFSLASSAAARMYRVGDDAPFTSVSSMVVPAATYTVYFSSGGNEQVTASGAYIAGNTAVAFLGAASITVTSSVKLVYNAGENGTIVGNVSQTVLTGMSGNTVVAVPADGYSFVMWSDGVKTAARTDRNVTSDINVTAIFAAEGAHVVLYVAGEGGSISGSAAQVLTPGQSGTPVEAVADPGYVFVSWSDGLKEAARADGSIKSDVEITASFAKVYSLRYIAGANGTLDGLREQSVAAGSSGAAVTAVPNTGYRFDSWSDGVATAKRTDADVGADISVTARFVEDKYTLTYRAAAGQGVILVSSNAVQEYTDRVDPGSEGPSVMAIGNVDDGYTFHHWSDGLTTATRKDGNVQGDMTVIAYFADADGNVSVASGDRTIPNGGNVETVVVAPVVSVTGEFTAGPNPVGKSSGGIAFFWQGKRVKGGSLTVYDAAGNVVKKVAIRDNAVTGNTGKRAVGSWDLKDSKGCLVSDGTYLVKGKIAASGGKAERVSVVVGVR
jgi:hypothetical protein